MNSFIKAIKELNLPKIEALIQKDAKWLAYAEESGKNALHYLGGVKVGDDEEKAQASLDILQYLLRKGMDINAVHQIADDGCDIFPATPLWYAYTKGRNKNLYTWLLEAGANPGNCMYAIVWNDDLEAAELFYAKGAGIQDKPETDTPFLSAVYWRRFAIAEWLLKKGADVNIQNAKGISALHCAVKRRYDVEHIQLLLDYGADIHLKNKEGVSAVELAENMRLRKILSVLNKN